MSKDIHDIEDFFRARLDPNFEDPSDDVWDKLNARLDKEAADTYKKKFFALKKVVLLLLVSLFLFAGFDAIFVRQTFRRQPIEGHSGSKFSPDISTERQLVEKKTGNSRNYYTDTNSHLPIVTLKSTSGNIKNYHISDPPDSIESSNSNREIIEKKKLSVKHFTTSNNTTRTMGGLRTGRRKNMATYVSRESSMKQSPSPRKIETASVSKPVLPLKPDDRFFRKNVPEAGSIPPASIPLKNARMEINLTVRNIDLIKMTQFHPYLAFTAFTSHEWTDYTLEDDERNHQALSPQDDKDDIKHREEHKPSYSIGILATYEFKKRFAVQTGIIFENTNINIHPQKLYASNDAYGNIGYKYNVSSGYIIVNPNFGRNAVAGDSLTATEGQNNLKYVSIPFVIKYTWKFGRITVSPGAGIAANVLTSASIRTEIEDGIRKEQVSQNRIQGIKDIYAGMILNASVNYTITRSFGISFLSSFNYALIPITNRNIVKTYPFSTGLGLGLTYKR